MKDNHAFTIVWPTITRTLNTEIGITESFSDPAQALRSKPVFYKAIWDTGATGSVITSRVANALGLKPIGMTMVSTAGGQLMQNEYLVNIFLPNKLYVPNMRVTEGNLAGIDILIGMDIIALGDFAVTNLDGKSVLSFRMPSCQIIGYVKDNELLKLPRADRRRAEKDRGKL